MEGKTARRDVLHVHSRGLAADALRALDVNPLPTTARLQSCVQLSRPHTIAGLLAVLGYL